MKTDSFRALCYNAVFAIRRMDLVIMNVYFTQDSPLSGFDRSMYLQKILCFLYIQIFYIAYIHLVRPHNDSMYNKLEFINEYSMMGIAYCMINFSHVVSIQDPVTREPIPSDKHLNTWVEYLAIAFIALILVINFGAMIFISGKKLYMSIKKKIALKKHQKMIAEREKRAAFFTSKSSSKLMHIIVEEKEDELSDDASNAPGKATGKGTKNAGLAAGLIQMLQNEVV